MAERVDAASGWDWLNGAARTPDDADRAASFARCFAGPDGARVLGALKAMTLDRALGPDAPEAALRHLEGQRQLVATILALVARGRGA